MSVHRDWLAEEGRLLAAALEGDATAPVPTCPGWSVTDLVAHVGGYHRWVADLLRTAAQEPRAPYDVRPTPDLTLAEWYLIGLDLLLEAIDATDPETPMWTVTVDQKAGAWCRRQAHDLTLHRWDAQNTHGTAGPVAPERAVDFIDELFELALPYILPFLGRPVPGASLALRSPDGAYQRRVEVAGGRPSLSRSTEPADAVLTGTPPDLLLTLWRRTDTATLTGPPSVLAAWQEAIG